MIFSDSIPIQKRLFKKTTKSVFEIVWKWLTTWTSWNKDIQDIQASCASQYVSIWNSGTNVQQQQHHNVNIFLKISIIAN